MPPHIDLAPNLRHFPATFAHDTPRRGRRCTHSKQGFVTWWQRSSAWPSASRHHQRPCSLRTGPVLDNAPSWPCCSVARLRSVAALPSSQWQHFPRLQLKHRSRCVRRILIQIEAALLARVVPVSLQEIAARANAAAEASRAAGKDPSAAEFGFEAPPTAVARALLGDTVKQAEERAAADKQKKREALLKRVAAEEAELKKKEAKAAKKK